MDEITSQTFQAMYEYFGYISYFLGAIAKIAKSDN